MAGGFPPNWRVKKNMFMEEWNGKREVSDKIFEFDSNAVPTFVFGLIVFPVGLYYMARWEFQKRDPRRFKDVC